MQLKSPVECYHGLNIVKVLIVIMMMTIATMVVMMTRGNNVEDGLYDL